MNPPNVSNTRWSTDETNFLLNLWSSYEIQSLLDGTVRDAEVYRVLSMKLREAGFQRTAAQVRTRIKCLKASYRAEKGKIDSGTCSGKMLFRYYQQMDRVMGDGKASPATTAIEEAPIKIESVETIERIEEPGVRLDEPSLAHENYSSALFPQSSAVAMDQTPSFSDHPTTVVSSSSFSDQPSTAVSPIHTTPLVSPPSFSDQPSTAASSDHPITAVASQSFPVTPTTAIPMHMPKPRVCKIHPTKSKAVASVSLSTKPDYNVYDLCIVGAGMFGSAAARHASANVGLKICLIGPAEPSPQEMPNRDIFGSHYDEGRITCSADDDMPSHILAENSIKRYRELEKLSGIDFYYPVGNLSINTTNTLHSKGAKANLPVLDLSYNDIFERRFPYIKLRSGDYPIFADYGAGYINPRNMVAAQKKVARNQDCHIIDDVVHEVKPLANGIHEIITENQGLIKAKRVLICTGAFTNFKTFPMPKLQIDISKETAALMKVSFKEAKRLSAMPTICYCAPCRPDVRFGAYILPPILYPDGFHYLKIGPIDFESCSVQLTLEEIKNWYLSKGDLQKIDTLSKFLTDMLPGLKCEEVTGMACVTCYSRSGLPYIDRVSPTVAVAVVGNGTGARYSDEVGRIAATLSLTGKWESELPKSHFQVVYQS